MLYRTTDLAQWGAGKEANLTAEEIDANFWELLQRVVAVEGDAPEPNNIASVTVVGSQMTINMEDGSTHGPFTLPTAMIHYRGDWVAAANYDELDVVAVPDDGIYLVLRPHVAGAAFDAAATDGGGNLLYRWMLPMGGGASTLAELGDVWEGLAPSEGDFLMWDGTMWDAYPAARSISDLAEVYGIDNPEAGQVLVFNATGTGWWEVADLPAGGGGGAATFLDLTDTPAAFGTAGQFVAVNGTTDGLAFVDPPAGGGGITDAPIDGAQYARQDGTWEVVTVSWGSVSGKPATFAPSAHTHPWGDVTDRPAVVDALPGAVGTDGQVLKAAGGAVVWGTDEGGGTGATSFLGLSDTPAAYGTPGYVVTINGTGDGLVFEAAGGGGSIGGSLAVTGANVATGAFTADAWAKRSLNSTAINTIDGATVDLGTDEVTLPAGTYDVFAFADFWRTETSAIRLYDVTNSAVLMEGDGAYSINNNISASVKSVASGRLTLAVETTIRLEYFVENGTTAALGNGAPAASGATNIAAGMVFNEVTAGGGGGGGAATFLDLTDTPAAFGTPGQIAVVNATGNAFEFADQPTGDVEEAPINGQLYGRADGGWATIDLPAPEGHYRYWRMRLTSEDQLSGTNAVYLSEIEFRAVAGVAEPATGGTVFGNFGVVENLFNGNTTSAAQTPAPYTDKVAGYDFGSPRSIEQVAVKSASNLAVYAPSRFVIEASNDDVTYTEVAREDPMDPAWGGAGVVTRLLAVAIPVEPVSWEALTDVPAMIEANGTIEDVVGVSYTPVTADAGKWKRTTSADPVAVTIDANVHATGHEITWEQGGAGLVTFGAGAGMTLTSRDGALSSAGQYAVMGIKFRSPTEATLFGDIA